MAFGSSNLHKLEVDLEEDATLTGPFTLLCGGGISLGGEDALPMWKDFVKGILGVLLKCSKLGTKATKMETKVIESLLDLQLPYTVPDSLIRRLGVDYLDVLTKLFITGRNDKPAGNAKPRGFTTIHAGIIKTLLKGQIQIVITQPILMIGRRTLSGPSTIALKTRLDCINSKGT